jgi:hypothetical protein
MCIRALVTLIVVTLAWETLFVTFISLPLDKQKEVLQYTLVLRTVAIVNHLMQCNTKAKFNGWFGCWTKFTPRSLILTGHTGAAVGKPRKPLVRHQRSAKIAARQFQP